MPFPDVNSFTPVQSKDTSPAANIPAWNVQPAPFPPTASKAAQQADDARRFGNEPGFLIGYAGLGYSELTPDSIPTNSEV